MSNIGAYLPTSYKKVQGRHPLVSAEARLARKIVQVRDQPRHEVSEARVAGLGVDAIGVWGDVVDCEVLEGRGLRVFHGCLCAVLFLLPSCIYMCVSYVVRFGWFVAQRTEAIFVVRIENEGASRFSRRQGCGVSLACPGCFF